MPTFRELGLRAEIVQALDDLGFENPTPIQEKAIPQVLDSKRDLIALAQTGTGKTAAFSLPVLQQLDENHNEIQCIVLCPTRELCLQIANDMKDFAKYINPKTVAVYGGASIETQIREIKRGCQVIIGTPGRTVDLINRRVLRLQDVRFVVLDEADEMLTMGFKDDLDLILGETPATKQTLLFSATMPSGIKDITKKYMNDPIEVSSGQRNEGAANIEHHYYMVDARNKYECLKRLADVNPNVYGIVFCRTRRETQEIADKLMTDGYNADSLHGDLSQAQRDNIMARFRKRKIQLLVATDVAARGIDVDDITHVINYNLPDEEEVYIHRSGRTGRAGKRGISIAIIHSRERGKLKSIEHKLKKQFEQRPVPTGQEICETQLYTIVERLSKLDINEKQIEPFLPAILEQLGHLTKEDLVKHLVSFEFNKFLDYYKNSRDLNVVGGRDDRSSRRDRDDRPERGDRDRGRDRDSRDSRGDRGASRDRDFGGDDRPRRSSSDRFLEKGKFTRFHINLGTKDNMNPANLMGLINESLSRRDVEIGKIELMNTFAFFELDSDYADKLTSSLKGSDYAGKKVDLTIAKSTGARDAGSRDSDGPARKDKFRDRFNKDRGGSSRSSSGGKSGGSGGKRPRRPF
ncbi:MAG: DEAD/DEAH box helicase [Flavobacteriales bacterium]|nr:DEAD/DEAH box helicase [Flavobacteriales bacterium]